MNSTREPSIIYLRTSFALLGIMQMINIVLSSTLILTIVLHRTHHTILNLLTANSSFAIFIYAIAIIAQLIVGLQPRDKGKEDLCIFLSFYTSIAADAICYSYLVTAISQYFFNILYRRRYLLTFRIHWFIILLSWSISCLLPLFLYLPGELQYSTEMHICTTNMSLRWVLFAYMGGAVGVPFFGIIIIYLYIVCQIRRMIAMAIPGRPLVSVLTRNLRVLKHILTLIGILGTATFPSFILVIWNAISLDKAPIPLYLLCALTISLCTNIQILFIFSMNKKIRTALPNRARRIFR